MSLFHLPVHINWMWHLRNVRRECWEIFKGRQYHSPYFTWAPLVASTFTKEHLLLVISFFGFCEFLSQTNNFLLWILTATYFNIYLQYSLFWNEYNFLRILIAHTSIFLDNIYVFVKKITSSCEFLSSDISIFPDKWIMAASWANNEPLCRSSNFWNFNLLCIISTIYDTAKKYSFPHRLSIITCTVVEESYLKDFVCPFSKNTFRTFGIRAMTCVAFNM